jgi:hypothetical protein
MRNKNALAGQPIPKFPSPNAQSDEALMKAIAAGDESGMRTLYLRHNASVFRFIARMLNDPGRAETLLARSSSTYGVRPTTFKAVRRY